MVGDRSDEAAAVGVERSIRQARGAERGMKTVGDTEAGERGETEGADPRGPLGRGRPHVPAEDHAAKPAGQRLELQLPLEHPFGRLGREAVDRRLEKRQRRVVGADEPGEEQSVGLLVSSVDGEHGHAVGTRGDAPHDPAGEPAAENGHLPRDDPIALEEDRGPADPLSRC